MKEHGGTMKYASQKSAKAILERFGEHQESLDKFAYDIHYLAATGFFVGTVHSTHTSINKLEDKLRKLGNLIAESHGLKMQWPA
jgi:hypothetical protein